MFLQIYQKMIIQQCRCLFLNGSQIYSEIFSWPMAFAHVFSSRDGRVPVESSIVNYITDLSGDGGQPTVCRAMADPGKVLNLYCQDKTILIRREGLRLTATNICANGPVVGVVGVGGAADRLRVPVL
jgi:hypothetical protein